MTRDTTRREALRASLSTAVAVAGLSGVTGSASAQTTITYDSTDLDNAVAETGVVHQNTTNTDHNNASVLKQGYDYANFSEISPTPVSCWPLHEDSGSTAYDVAGSNDGTYNGPTLGQQGLLETTSPSFDGVDDISTVPDDPTLRGYGDFSISAWVYPEQDQYMTIVAKRGGDIYQLEYGESGSSVSGPYIQVGDGSSFPFAQAGQQYLNEWVHVVGVRDTSSDNLRLYTNGNLRDETTEGLGSPTLSPTEDVGIGARIGNGQSWDGRIWMPMIFTTALTDQQVTTLYNVVGSPGELVTQPKVS